ncbi:MAG: flippase-like domain-containing protein [Candidatus Riflebacteria bacterium]|nr:flippase-like domain-containing protein [Candidatus Riflebacteria bacterium]
MESTVVMRHLRRRTGLSALVWLGFLVSAVFLVYFFRGVSWDGLARAFRDADYIFLIPTLAINLGTYPIRTYRWYFLLPRTPGSTFRNRFSATVIGFMATSIFPLRAGEVIRAATYSLKTGTPVGTSLASIALERLLDLIIVLCGLGICLVYLPAQAAGEGSAYIDAAKKAGVILGAIVVAIVLFLMLLKVRGKWALGPARWAIGLMPQALAVKLNQLLDSVVAGLVIVTGLGEVLWLLLLSVVHWAVAVAGIWVCARAFQMPISPIGALLLFVFTCLSVLLPQAPGFIGVFQVAAKASLTLLGQPSSQAEGFALVYWALCIVPITLVGFAALSLEGLSLDQVRTARDQTQEPAR